MDINKIAYERAEFARDMEYIKNNVEDSIVQDSILSLKSKCPDAFDDCNFTDEELDEAISKISVDSDEREEEINRILQATDDITLDEVMGIETDDLDIESEV